MRQPGNADLAKNSITEMTVNGYLLFNISAK